MIVVHSIVVVKNTQYIMKCQLNNEIISNIIKSFCHNY